MENQEKRIVEINGVKMEVDMRHAKVIENYKVGDCIKVLKKQYSDYKSYIGVIVGFDDFATHPTIVIAFLDSQTYGETKIEFVYVNSETKDVEITSLNNWDLPITKARVIERFNAELQKKEQEIVDIKTKMNVFENLFGKYFENKVANEQSEF